MTVETAPMTTDLQSSPRMRHATQALINLGMTVGLVPIIGGTLPFVSYGGASMLTSWLMTGLVMNVGFRRPDSSMIRGDQLDPLT